MKIPNSGLELESELVLLSYWLLDSFYGDGSYGKNVTEASMVDHSIILPLTMRILNSMLWEINLIQHSQSLMAKPEVNSQLSRSLPDQASCQSGDIFNDHLIARAIVSRCSVCKFKLPMKLWNSRLPKNAVFQNAACLARMGSISLQTLQSRQSVSV